MESFIGSTFTRGISSTKVSIEQVLQADVVLLLFSGKWCPPCNGFAPVIKNFYNNVNKGCIGDKKRVEIVFISCDNSIEEYKSHASEFPYACISFDDPKIVDLQDALEIENIPVVTLLRKDGTIAKENIRQIIQTKGINCFDDIRVASQK